jgi:single-strand DNA-binding protein
MVKLQIVGNLGADCIQKEVNGKNVINFNVAHTEKYKDAQGNPVEKTTWVNCAYWTDKTGIAQYLTKGKMVYAEGAPEADGYTNKDGQVAATLRMRVLNIQLLGGNTNDNNQANPGNQNNVQSNYSNSGNVTNSGNTPAPAMRTPAPVADMPLDDDLPF